MKANDIMEIILMATRRTIAYQLRYTMSAEGTKNLKNNCYNLLFDLNGLWKYLTVSDGFVNVDI